MNNLPAIFRKYTTQLWYIFLSAAFFFVFAVFFAQLDYIAMFFQITAAVWLGGGGTVMVFGLYSRFGNVVGAWCSVVFGCGFSVLGFVLQRTWAAHVVPLLRPSIAPS